MLLLPLSLLMMKRSMWFIFSKQQIHIYVADWGSVKWQEKKQHWFSCICWNASMCVYIAVWMNEWIKGWCIVLMDSLSLEKKNRLTLLKRFFEFALKLWNLCVCINNIINFGWLILPHSHARLGDFPKKECHVVYVESSFWCHISLLFF